MHYCSDNNATREYRRISTRDYDVAQTEPGMPRNIVDESLIDSTSIPMKIAEISFSTYGTTYIGMRIEHRNNNRIMFRHEIDNTHDAETARHAHIFSHTVGITFVYGYEVGIRPEVLLSHKVALFAEYRFEMLFNSILRNNNHIGLGCVVYL